VQEAEHGPDQLGALHKVLLGPAHHHVGHQFLQGLWERTEGLGHCCDFEMIWDRSCPILHLPGASGFWQIFYCPKSLPILFTLKPRP
jgi:hypothetical protein